MARPWQELEQCAFKYTCLGRVDGSMGTCCPMVRQQYSASTWSSRELQTCTRVLGLYYKSPKKSQGLKDHCGLPMEHFDHDLVITRLL